jgi:hypothetical protein
MNSTLEITGEVGRWRSREMKFVSGRLDQILGHIPTFAFGEFKVAEDEPANPHLKTIVRVPQTDFERPIPIAVVSPNYTLLQHRDLAELCASALGDAGLPIDEMKFEVGLSKFGELMVFRMYLPDAFNFKGSDGHEMGLRVECINSVDGSYRLVVLFGWLRFVCLNGLVIGKTLTEIREIHSGDMKLDDVVQGLQLGLSIARGDSDTLALWQETEVLPLAVREWADDEVAKKWGVKAAMRTYHIAMSGQDVTFADPFAKGRPTEKPVQYLDPVPGAPAPSKTVYDVTQALTWVATQQLNFEQRVQRQSEVPSLVESLLAGGARH